jgi:hypothetical protein
LPTSFVNQDAASKKAAELVDLEMNAEGKVKPEGGSDWGGLRNSAEDKAAISTYEKERNSRIAQKTLELMGVDKPQSTKKGMVNNLGNIRGEDGKIAPSKGVDEDIKKLDRQLEMYGTGESAHTKQGEDISLRKLFSIYAPKEDRNDPVQYAKNVSKAFGDKFSIDTPIDLTDPEIRKKVIPYIIKQEGVSTVTPEIRQAIDKLSDNKKEENTNKYKGFKMEKIDG